MIDSSIPVLVGEPANAAECKVWCPWCRRYHFHGMDPDGSFNGHRAAHCHGGPFQDTGYYVVDRKTAARLRPVQRQRVTL